VYLTKEDHESELIDYQYVLERALSGGSTSTSAASTPKSTSSSILSPKSVKTTSDRVRFEDVDSEGSVNSSKKVDKQSKKKKSQSIEKTESNSLKVSKDAELRRKTVGSGDEYKV